MKNLHPEDPATRHAHGPQEHTLCGVAFDAHGSGDWPVELLYADKGHVVNCEHCMAVIEFTYTSFTRKGRVR